LIEKSWNRRDYDPSREFGTGFPMSTGGCSRAGNQGLHTPDGPTNAVAELTLGALLSLLRHIRKWTGRFTKGNGGTRLEHSF
jgi:phosphoglycerate dehydrogenase-like enzyme